MTGPRGPEHPPGIPANWQDWQHWVEGVDWSDWRSWLQRLAAADWASTDWTATDWAAGSWPGSSWERAPQAHEVIPLTLRAFGEDEPGERMAGQLNAAWPAFRRWWQEGANARPDADEARARLEQHMPELVPTWQRLAAMLGDDPVAGAALAL